MTRVIADVLGLGDASQRSGQQYSDLTRRVIEGTIVWNAFHSVIRGVKTAIEETIKAGIDWEVNMANIKRTVEGTPEQIAKIGTELRNMAKEMPVTANELAKIAMVAGQIGVASKDITKFTEVMGKLSATTNIVGESGAAQLARFMNIMQASFGDIDKFGAALLDLGRKSAATETEILTMAIRLAGAGQLIKMSGQDVLAFSAALSSAGLRAEMGGSAMSKVMMDVSEAVFNGGVELEQFAEISKMTSAEFSKLFKEDSAAALVKFIVGLRSVSDAGMNTFAVLRELGQDGIRLRATLLQTAATSDILTKALNDGRTAYAEGTALNQAFGDKAETTASKLATLKNQIHDVMIEIGTGLMPTVLSVASAFTAFIEHLRPLEPLFVVIAQVLPEIIALLVLTFGAAFLLRVGESVVSIIKLTMAFITLSPSISGAIVPMSAFEVKLLSLKSAIVSTQGKLLIIIAAVFALDLALQIFTGKGLFARIFGDEQIAKTNVKLLNEIIGRMQELDTSARVPQILLEINAILRQQLQIRADIKRAENRTGDESPPRVVFDNSAIQGRIEMLKKLDLSASEVALTFGSNLNPEFIKIIAHVFDLDEKAVKAGWGRAMQEQAREMEEGLALVNNAFKNIEGTSTFTFPPTKEQVAAAKEALKEVEGAVDDFLPKIGQPFKEWKKEMDIFFEAFNNQAKNIDDIWNVLTAAGIRGVDQIIDGLRRGGPLAVQQFMEFLFDHPMDILEMLGQQGAVLAEASGGLVSLGVGVGLGNGAAVVSAGAMSGIANPIGNVLDGVIRYAGSAARVITGVILTSLNGDFPEGGITPSSFITRAKTIQDFLEEFNAGKTTKRTEEKNSGGGGGGGAAKEIKEVLSLIDSFNKTIAEKANFREMVKKFGDGGAKIMEAFNKAITAGVDDAESAGANFANSIDSWINDAIRSNVPNAADWGRRIVEAGTAAIIENTPEAKAALEKLMKDANEVFNADKNMKLTAGTFADTFAKAFADAKMEAKIGSAGTKLMESFWKAVNEGGGDNIRRFAENAADMLATLQKKDIGADAFAQLKTNFTNALNDVINNATPANIAKFQEAMAQIKIIMDGGALAVSSNTLVMAEDIKKLASNLGLSADDIIKNIDFFVNTGLFKILDTLKDLTPATKDAIEKTLDQLKAGKLTIGQAVTEIWNAIVKGASATSPLQSGTGPGGGGGGGGSKVDPKTIVGSIPYQIEQIRILQEKVDLLMGQSHGLTLAGVPVPQSLAAGLVGGLTSLDSMKDELNSDIEASVAARASYDPNAIAQAEFDTQSRNSAAQKAKKEALDKAKMDEYRARVREILPHIVEITKQINSGTFSSDALALLKAQLKDWKNKLDKARDGLTGAGFSNVSQDGFNGVGKISGFAGGVRNFMGGMAVVGERGPELVRLPRGSDVYSNSQSKGMGGVNVQLIINSPITDVQSLRRAIPQISEEIRRYKGR